MYIIDKNTNRITKLNEKSFTELGFRERNHLQEWIANNPESLGEEILIIQKEFNGFNDTNERLDLLGIDKQGNLIVIENKLDDTGRDVTWQALKYASYCSTLKKEHIRRIYQDYLDKQSKGENAEENLIEFFNANDFAEISLNSGQTQRIIMVAAHFRKEVTSTVLWLLNYKLRIQCFKATPFEFGDQLVLNIEQIIPMKEAEDYVISMADKTQDDINTQEELKSRYIIRLEFWKQLLKEINSQTNSWQNISPSKDNWLAIGSGLSGVTFNFVITNQNARVEIYISRSKEENKLIFKILKEQENEIESVFAEQLIWQELPDKKASRIKLEKTNFDYFQKEDWPEIIKFLVHSMLQLEKTFREPISRLRTKLK
ncbi:MAG TPA: DUF4268 domain-containing protein [Flavobacterium sp.]|uniref:DUF4268 domain-containing protein n=2 Tax=Flavobacterium TaxID=237 RepID=UPI0025C2C03D|nr:MULTISPECIES: DUF4268 domain-containing protein [unclassified Flavobacterium]HRE76597.1 DUF4268 domain-containing protein [Flavobacterium sp.]